MENFWDSSVWGTINLVAVLLISLLGANVLKKSVRFLRVSLIPTSVLGGGILLILSGVYSLFADENIFNSAFFGGNGAANLEIITYHALALGFIASALKTTDSKLNRQRTNEIFNTGVTTVATYLLQGVVGMAITMVAAKLISDFFSVAGLLLPFGYGQGTGQALNYGNIYETEFGFDGGKSFGLTIAALGFLSASIGGVIHLNILRKKGKITIVAEEDHCMQAEEIQAADEIPMQGSMDKITIQMAVILGAYFLASILMSLLGSLVPGFRSVIYGFNFIIGVLTASLLKWGLKFLRRKGLIKKQYTNNFLLTRCSNFFFDIMVVAGIAAIRLSILEQYWGIILILGVAGAVITYWYNHYIAKTLFPDYAEAQFLTMYGMLTGTASTGIILLREFDPNFETPAADNMVYQNFPAIVFGFPLMLLATLAPGKPLLTLGILVAFFAVLNLILFRSKLFGRRNRK